MIVRAVHAAWVRFVPRERVLDSLGPNSPPGKSQNVSAAAPSNLEWWRDVNDILARIQEVFQQHK